MADEETKDESGETRSWSVVPYVPDGMEILFSDGVYVTHSQGTFILSFVQTEHPLAATEDQRARIKEVRSRCIARVALAPHRIPAMIEVLQRTFNKVLAEIEAQEVEEGHGQAEVKDESGEVA